VVESPASALARAAHEAASSVEPLDAAACLQAWCASARRILRDAHRQPGQVVLLDADEVHLSPAAARLAWRGRAGLDAAPVDLPVKPAQARIDALGLAAAALVVAEHADASRLWCELQGSCLLLQEVSSLASGPSADLALKAWREWQLNLADLQQTLADCRARLVDSQLRLTSLEGELAQARDDASLAEMMRRQTLTELESFSVMAAQTDLVDIIGRFDPSIVKMCGDGSKAED
jgi:hypothetical protein